jgi:hypothetical protein
MQQRRRALTDGAGVTASPAQYAQHAPCSYPERMTPEDFDEAQRSFQKPLHSYALIEV